MIPFLRDLETGKWRPNEQDKQPRKENERCPNPWCIGVETCPWCPIDPDKRMEFELRELQETMITTEAKGEKTHTKQAFETIHHLLHLGPSLGCVDGLILYDEHVSSGCIYLFHTAYPLSTQEWKAARKNGLFANLSACTDLQDWCRNARQQSLQHSHEQKRRIHYNAHVALVLLNGEEVSKPYRDHVKRLIQATQRRFVQDMLTGQIVQTTPYNTNNNTNNNINKKPIALVEPKSRHLVSIIAWKGQQPFGFLLQPPLPIPYELLQKHYPDQVYPYPSSKQNWQAFLKQHHIPATYRTSSIKRPLSLITLQNTYHYVFFPFSSKPEKQQQQQQEQQQQQPLEIKLADDNELQHVTLIQNEKVWKSTGAEYSCEIFEFPRHLASSHTLSTSKPNKRIPTRLTYDPHLRRFKLE